MGRSDGEKLGLWIEVPATGRRKQERRFRQVIGWTLAHKDEQGKELYYGGGGPRGRYEEGATYSMGSMHRGPVAWFVENGHYAVYYEKRERAEEVALLIALDDSGLMGQMYLCGVTALGVVVGSAKLERKKT